MARRNRKRSRLGLSPEGHRARAKGEVKELRRLHKRLRAQLAAGDCVHAAHLVHMIASREGAYSNDRRDSRGRNGVGSTESSLRLLDKFVHVCVVHAKTRAKIREESR